MKAFMQRMFAVGRLVLLGFAFSYLTAATTPNTFVAPITPKTKCIAFVQGTDSAGTYKTVLTGGTNGSKILGLYATSIDGSASHLVTVQISSSTSAHCSPASNCYAGAAATVAASSGFANATPAVNFLSSGIWPGLPIDSDGNPYFYLTDSTFTVEATFATALTASTNVNVCAVYADF